MRIIDLSHTLKNGMPVFPGMREPNFIEEFSVAKNGYKEMSLAMLTHTGTHIDCPAHMLESEITTDVVDLELFYCPVFVADFSTKQEGDVIQVSDFEKYSEELRKSKGVLIYTSWDKKWGKKEYFGNYPYLSVEAIKFLISNNILTIGLDVISIDAIDSMDYENHKLVLGAGGVIVENLCNLDKVKDEDFMFSALPLKIGGGDGSPVRAVAII
jgi:kynurenine formamidase